MLFLQPAPGHSQVSKEICYARSDEDFSPRILFALRRFLFVLLLVIVTNRRLFVKIAMR